MHGTISVGLIADTHGLLRPEAIQALLGSDFIIHAGDVGDPKIVEALARIAPVSVVRGNIDKGEWATALPVWDVLDAGSASIYVLHDLGTLDLDPAAAGFQAVVFGHSHQPSIRTQAGVLYVNPGSAGPRRFKLPISIGRLAIDGAAVTAELITLECGNG